MAFRTSLRTLARYDVNPHLVKMWKNHKHMDGQVVRTLSPFEQNVIGGFFKAYPAEVRKHEINLVVLLTVPRSIPGLWRPLPLCNKAEISPVTRKGGGLTLSPSLRLSRSLRTQGSLPWMRCRRSSLSTASRPGASPTSTSSPTTTAIKSGEFFCREAHLLRFPF